MRSLKTVDWLTVTLSAVVLGGGIAAAQPGHEHGHAMHDKSADAAHAKRVGDPYPFDTCPISGKTLDANPVVRVYNGQEVRFCCPKCPAAFEKDLAGNLKKLDEKIMNDQRPIYPLKTSVVTGKPLPAQPYEFVYGNRLIQLGSESEKADFLKKPKHYLDELNKAVIAEQGKDYPLKTCPVSHDALGGDMGEPVDVVVAGRLIRTCCDMCPAKIEKEPAKYISMVDAARHNAHKNEPKHD